jgi:hypothetical protein
VGYLNPHVYAAPVDNKEALHYRIVVTYQTIRKYPNIFELKWQSMTRRVEEYIESLNTLKLVSGHMFVWTFFLFWYLELIPKICPPFILYKKGHAVSSIGAPCHRTGSYSIA